MAVDYGQVAIVPKGEWNVETQYKVNNLVSYDGSSYVAKVQPPVGTLPTDTSYWQVSAAGTKKATADSLGTVMPDGTTTSVGEDGKLSVNTAQQDALGVVKGSDDITVGEDGKMTLNTTFEQATELANIIAGEAIKSVLGKVSKAIATTMSLDENALLKNMISGIDVNDSNKVPSSAYLHTLVERIGMGTELVSGLGDLTTGLNTVNNNLSVEVNDLTDLLNPDYYDPAADYYLRIYRVGNVKVLSIAIKAKALTGNDIIASNIPEKLRPAKSAYIVIQGRDVGEWARATYTPVVLEISGISISMSTGVNASKLTYICGMAAYI